MRLTTFTISLVSSTLLVFLLGPAVRGSAVEPPRSPEGAAKVSLFASEPEIVTPIGATIDAKGRLLVIESNSHFRPKNYQGPASDRIRVLEDSSGAGKADRISTFFEGVEYMMNLAGDRDGSVVVCSRNEVFRLVDPDGRGSATKKITLAHLQTTANYPHNGLDGLTIASNGDVYFGIGENLGAPWTLVGTDGASINEDKGTGCVFRVDRDGRGLRRVARGMWNPFGLGVDPAGNLWAVDNDPDGRPPSRLLHVVPGADFGFEFRYGRTGLHPLQAWDGELPGTRGMVSGVGEAPCEVRWHDGHLLVSSWRDHQIESYTLHPVGATYRATMQPVIVGGPDFRPVGMAIASDGTLYVTDWGSASYEINHKGRVWKITLPHDASAPTAVPTDAAMARADRLRQSNDVSELTTALGDEDPAICQAAQFGLSRLRAVEKIDLSSLKSPEQRVGLLAAMLWRGADASKIVSAALNDPDVRVREMGVRVVTEQGIAAAKPELERMIGSPVMSPRLLGMVSAAISQLSGDPAAKVQSKAVNALLTEKLNSADTPDPSKAVLLRMLPPDRVTVQQLRPLLESTTPLLQLEAVRSLSEMNDPARADVLGDLAESSAHATNVRAEAVVGLAYLADTQSALLIKLAQDPAAALRQEALRSLRSAGPKLTAQDRNQLGQVAKDHPAEREMVDRVLGRPPAARPAESDEQAWQKILDQAPGDPESGRRIFFQPAGPACYRCHMIEGRGRAIGPDLTMIGHSRARSHILQSILDPGREIAPLYTMWSIRLKDGQQVDGMLLRRDGQENEIYVDANATETRVKEPDVAERRMRKESLMPAGLVLGLTDQELRDVVAMLEQKR